MDGITVSVRMLTYNQEKYIRQSIDSVLEQVVDFKIEIIVGDDNSTDATPQILQEYYGSNEKVKLVLRKENVGATQNLYDITMKCRGKYIILLEGDDYWTSSNKLASMVKFLEQESTYIGISHIREIVAENGEFLKYDYSQKQSNIEISLRAFLRGVRYSDTATLYHNIYMDRNLDFTMMYKADRMVADFTECIMMLERGNVYRNEECTGAYRTFEGIDGTNYNSIYKKSQIIEQHFKLLNYIRKNHNKKYYFMYDYLIWIKRIFRYSNEEQRKEYWKIGFKELDFVYRILMIVYYPIFVINKNWNRIIRKMKNVIKGH